MNDLQLSAFTIIDKTMGKENITTLGKNIRLISERCFDYLSQAVFLAIGIGLPAGPVYLAGCFSNLAHVFFYRYTAYRS